MWRESRRTTAATCMLLATLAFWAITPRAQSTDSTGTNHLQTTIQNQLNEYSLLVEDEAAQVAANSPVGELLVQFARYLEDLTPNANLSPIINYRVMEYLIGRNSDEEIDYILDFNRSHGTFGEDEFVLNVIIYARKIRDGFELHDDLAVGGHLKNLRYLAPHSKERKNEYIALLRSSKGYLYSREIGHWKDHFRDEICQGQEARNSCIDDLEHALEASHREFDAMDIKDVICTVGLVYEKEYLQFSLCDL